MNIQEAQANQLGAYLGANKQQDLNQSVGPPSGMVAGDLNESFKAEGSFRNPWVVIPRPMNGFTELNPMQYER